MKDAGRYFIVTTTCVILLVVPSYLLFGVAGAEVAGCIGVT